MGNFQHVDRVVVRWPGGDAETFRGLLADRFWRIVQGTGRAMPYRRSPLPPVAEPLGGALGNSSAGARSNRSGRVTFGDDDTNTAASTSQLGRLVLLNPVPLPALQYHSLQRPDDSVSLLRGRPLLLGLWATWCAPCIDELSSWSAHHDRLTRAGLSVTVLCVDQPLEDPQQNLAKVRRVTEQLRVPFDVGTPQGNLVQFLDIAQRTFTFAQRPLPLPCSFLIDAQGRLAVVYKGPVSVDQLIEDSRLLEADDNTVLAGAVPFAGRWLEQLEPLPLRKLVLALHEAGQVR